MSELSNNTSLNSLFKLVGRGYSYDYDEGNPKEPFMNLGANIDYDGYIHSHFIGGLSIFTATDKKTIFDSEVLSTI